LKVFFPEGAHSKINQILSEMDIATSTCGSFGNMIVKRPLIELVLRLESNDINPNNFLRLIQRHLVWSNLFSDGIKNGIQIDPDLDAVALRTIRKVFLRDIGAGKRSNLKKVLNEAVKWDDFKKKEPKFRDISTTNIIITLSEIIYDSENFIENILPGSYEKLMTGKYDEINALISESNLENEQIRIDIKRKLEISKILKPLLKQSHTFVSIMPILLTMLYGEQKGLDKIRKDCNNILNEFTMGAELQRIAISLKEKIFKDREIEEIKINTNIIQKIFSKFYKDLNINVLSYLRRMKIQTIIEDSILIESQEMGLDFTRLNSTFGIKRAPEYFNDIKIEINRRFSNSIMNYLQIIKNRIAEEIAVNIDMVPNLVLLNHFISEIREMIEQSYLLIPTHVAPLYSGGLFIITENIEEINQLVSPLKDLPLVKILNNETKKHEFYTRIDSLYRKLVKNYRFFKEFLTLGIKLALADQNMIIEFTKVGGNKNQHFDGYNELFEMSLKRLKRMVKMKTLSAENANTFEKKIIMARKTMKRFIFEWTAVYIKKTLEQANKLKGN
jgi:hypothetical protein